jgi:hypothetical protein
MDVEKADASHGIAFLVSAGVVYEIIAAACSSPQTTEINAASRAGTLMKWVHVGLVQAALLVGIGAYLDKKRRGSIIAGGSTAGVIMYGSYWHAKRAGLRNGGPSTEDTGGKPAAPFARVPRWA